MNILEIIFIFLIGCVVGGLVGYLICLLSWVKELSREGNDIEMEISRIKAEMRRRR